MLFPIFFAAWFPLQVAAQKIEIGAALGGFNYKGDINPFWHVANFRPSGGLFLRYNVSPSFVLRGNVQGGWLTGNARRASDAYLSEFADSLDLAFSTTLFEVAAIAEYNFFDFRNEKYRRWSPYIFGGVAMFMFSPAVTRENADPFFLQPSLPFGVGMKYILSRNWNLGLELGTRKTFTDYLDNASDTDLPTQLQRGNPYTQDWYGFLGVTISYTIYTVPCPYFGD
ncbi:DUF6089 family protein [Catalinimonas alkaloidigena]|nr:DUF6089 family protein [Catalinimonas alkaloidigena]